MLLPPHVRDLEIDMGVTYKTASRYTRTGIRSTADLAVDNLEVESVFSDDKSTERIDGIVALIMAIGRAIVAQEELHVEYQLMVF